MTDRSGAGVFGSVPPGRDGEKERSLEWLYRLLIESVIDYAIFVLDDTGHVLTWNAGAERLKGYTAEQIIGRHFSTFYPPEDLANGKPAMELKVASEVGRFEDEGWRVRRDGTLFWANVIITALHDETGRLVGFAKVTRDLTERRAAEQRAIEDAQRVAEAEAANRAKSEFLAAMSHELRTPLNAIGGYVDLLALGLRGPVNQQQLDDLERIRRSQLHLAGIINDLLNFSRIEAGRLRYDLRDVAVRTLLEEVRPVIDPLADARDIGIDWPSPDAAAIVHADAAKAEQILINLLTNAIKFTAPGGRVTVTVRTAAYAGAATDGGVATDGGGAMDSGGASADVMIGVTDTGIGIPADRLEEVFEPFVQVGRSLSSAHEGTGLGLAISRELARAMNGDLTVSSSPGAGSTFTLRLPAPV